VNQPRRNRNAEKRANSGEPSQGDRPWLWITLAAAVAVRAIYFVQYQRSPLAGYHIVDQEYYLDWARRIAAGDLLGSGVFEQGPLYPYVLGLFLSLFGERLEWVLVLQMAVGVGICALVYDAARRLFSPLVARVAGLLAACYGPLVFYECMILKSFLEPALTMAACYALVRYREDRRLHWLGVSGLSIGLACLLRESHALLLVPAVVVSCEPLMANVTSRKKLSGVALLLAAAALPIVPCAWRNYRVAGELVLVTSGGGEVFYMAHGPQATGYYAPPDFIRARPPLEHEDFRREARRRTGQELTHGQSSRYWFGQGLREMAAHPLRTAWLTLVKGAVLLNNFEVPDSESYAVTREFVPFLGLLPSFGWIAGLGVAGIVYCLVDWRKRWLLPALVAAYALPVLLLYNFGRFRIGMLPLWILLAAMGSVRLIESWRQRDAEAGRMPLLAACLAVLATIVAFLPPLGRSAMTYDFGSAVLTGTLARRAGDIPCAEAEFRRAIELAADQLQSRQDDPAARDGAARRLAQAEVELANLLQEQGSHDEAKAHYLQAIAADPDSVEAHFNLARLLLAKGEVEPAIEHLQQAHRIDPRDSDVLVNLGGVYLNLGRPAEAVSYFEQALAIAPQNATAHYNLGNALLLTGQPEKAVDHYRRSLELAPGNADAHNNLGQALVRLDRLSEAEKEFRQALAIDPSHLNAAFNLARLFEARGDVGAAARAYQSILQRLPADSPQGAAIGERLRALQGTP
jgi:Tfp pilus assembly protein PilF/4-amino-4-deoxy-L-arabinose transferase-like glycosyltransferase